MIPPNSKTNTLPLYLEVELCFAVAHTLCTPVSLQMAAAIKCS